MAKVLQNTCKEYGPLRIYTTIYLSNASHTCTFLPVAARVRIKPSACSRYLLIFMIKPHNTLRHVSKETFNVHLVEISLTWRTCWYTLVLCGLLKNTSTSSLETPKVAEKQENWTKSTMWYGSKVYFLPHTRPNDSSLSVALERRNLKEKTKWNTESLTIYIILGIKGCNKPSPGLVSITLSEARPPKGGIQNLQTFDFILSSTFLGCHLQIGKKKPGLHQCTPRASCQLEKGRNLRWCPSPYKMEPLKILGASKTSPPELPRILRTW